MIPYITYKESDELGVLHYYILQKEFPHYVGVLLDYPKEGTWQSGVAGYRLWVVFHSTLRGSLIPSYARVGEEIQAIMEDMANWFHVKRITADPKRYKKFKINASAI